VKQIVATAVLIATTVALAPAHAALSDYPISGRWALGQNDHPNCAQPPYMEFQGNRRFDFGGSSVPEYLAMSIVPFGHAQYKILERFYNGMVEGQVTYTLQLRDDKHATLRFAMGGRVVDLARCT
jgi:hypothetical protein